MRRCASTLPGSGLKKSGLQYALKRVRRLRPGRSLAAQGEARGEVVVLTAGPGARRPHIREALAKGADRAIHIDCADLGSRDALGVAKAAGRRRQAGKPRPRAHRLQSDDLGQGQTGVILAELLGLPHSSLILHVEKTDTA